MDVTSLEANDGRVWGQTYIGFLVQKRHHFRGRHGGARARQRRAFAAMVGCVGVVAVPVRAAVAVRVRAVLPRSAGAGVREAGVGRVPAGELLAEKALQLPDPSSRAAGARALAARRRGDAGDGGPALVGEVGGIGRVGTAGRGGAAERGAQAGRQLRGERQVVGRVVVKGGGDGVEGGRRGVAGAAARHHPRRNLAQRAAGRVGLVVLLVLLVRLVRLVLLGA